MREILDFMRCLHDNNEREWFHAHQSEWKHVQGQFNAFVGELIEAIAAFDPSVAGLQVKDCTYRIARDTRFSNDKTPYKNWQGAYIAPKGKKSGFAGYYFHLEPMGDGLTGHNMLTSGIYCPEPVVLRSLREEILDNGAQIAAAIEASGFTLARENTLKRTPVGFPAGSQFDELLRLKDIYVVKPTSEEFLCAPALAERCAAEFRRTKTLIDILNRAVEYAHEEMN